MNALNPLHTASPQRPVTPAARQPEPSMEEILASIRRIIADDQAAPPTLIESPPAPAASAAPGPAAPVAPVGGPVAPAVREQPIADTTPYGSVTAPQFPTPEAPVMEQSAPAVEPPAPTGDAARGPAAVRRPTDAAPDSQASGGFSIRQDRRMRDHNARDMDFDAARDRPPEPAQRASALISPVTDQALSSAFNMLAATRLADDSEELRAMAREMIRPLLKTWLDDNLPSLVERLVRAEIERVARGGR